jgi:hypothetical protein
MQPFQLRVSRIIDFGVIVSLTGIDDRTGMPVTLHIDHRPFSFWGVWHKAGSLQPIEYAADGLILHLDMLPAGDADTVRLVEQDGAPAPTPSNDCHALEGMDR